MLQSIHHLCADMDDSESFSIDNNEFSMMHQDLRFLSVSGDERNINSNGQTIIVREKVEHEDSDSGTSVKHITPLRDVSGVDLQSMESHLADSTSTETDAETTVTRELLKVITTEDVECISDDMKNVKIQGLSNSTFVGSLDENIKLFRRSYMQPNNLSMATEPRIVPTEVAQLNAQLTQYKMKIRALTETLKQLNFDGAENIRNDKDLLQLELQPVRSINAFSIETDGNSDLSIDMKALKSENTKLTKSLDDRNKEFIKLKEELIQNKRDYETMLEEVNDFMQHNESLSQNLDEILKFLLENTSLSVEEYETLEKATNFESTFIDVKMKALSVNVNKLVGELNDYKNKNVLPSAEGTPVEVNSNVFGSHLENSEILNTKLEFAIEAMHKKYHDFILSIQKKLEKNELLEYKMKTKLTEQKRLLHEMAVFNSSSETNPCKTMEWRNSRLSLSSSIDDLNRRASAELSKSYQDHVNALNSMLLDYKRELEDKERQLTKLRNQLEGTLQPNADLELFNKLREQALHFEDKAAEWNRHKQTFQDTIERLENRNKELIHHISDLESELDMTLKHNKDSVSELKKKLNVALRKSSYYYDDNQLLQEQLEEFSNKISILQNDNSKLREQLMIGADGEKYQNFINTMKSQVLDHLKLIFGVLEKILQKESVDQAFAKLDHLEKMDSIRHFKKTMVKLDSVFIFIQTAVDSIVNEHVSLLLKHKSDLQNEQLLEGSTKQSVLKMEELRKKWIGERERRKLESEAAADRISILETENQKLREQLGIL